MFSFSRKKPSQKKSKPKVFCIGLNKTGTTTIEQYLKDNGYLVGDQAKAELLLEHWNKRDFQPIIDYCNDYEAFQDAPFSLPYTYAAIDQNFPDAKFILTLRDNAEQWYSSLTKFHSKAWCNGTDIPTAADLKQSDYRYKGYAYDVHMSMFNVPEDDPYNKPALLDYYNHHTYSVQEYFRSRPHKLITINVADDNDYKQLCKFLELNEKQEGFSWENKT